MTLDNLISLQKYGLDEYYANESAIYANLFIARVTEQHREQYKVITEHGELSAVVSGKLAYHADGKASFPAVGDWVMIDRMEDSSGNAVIHHILSRKSRFTRKAAARHLRNRLSRPISIPSLFACRSMPTSIFGGWNDI